MFEHAPPQKQAVRCRGLHQQRRSMAMCAGRTFVIDFRVCSSANGVQLLILLGDRLHPPEPALLDWMKTNSQ